MKAVLLDWTHNKHWVTIWLSEMFMDWLAKSIPNIEVERFDLLNWNIKFCNGCNLCTQDIDPTGATCPIRDDFEMIKKATVEADIVILVSPIYEYSVSSAMKRFLERCLTMVTFKFWVVPRLKPVSWKIWIILCSSGAPFPFNHLMWITRYPRFILRMACGLFWCEKIYSIYAWWMRISDKMKLKWEKKAHELGLKTGERIRKTRYL
ncbi:MAG: hypothetical protein ACD_2C00217G0001 [uncultured bacterium (gcode 4)]|uniref:NADPH-dependent FMN reductase-like domain-containing protein n=1 Tax=uncultured bacterium (gcode 4) TaxID=1234023 RepID=K2GFT4_9BACT|nr:MAG: hypothetical protein ACD_2C00217G0001 [uncultured bacterium (gcode 4)]